MRNLRWLAVSFLSLSLLSPPVSFAQGRGHGEDGKGGKGKVEKVEKRKGKDQDRRGKGDRGRKARDKKAHPHGKPARAERHRDRGDERRAEARRERAPRRMREARTERPGREARQARREVRRDRPVPARLIDELRREDRRARERIAERRQRAEAERLERARDGSRRLRAGDRRIRFRGLDADGDGRISRREWRGNDVSFRNHDWNRDGVLAGAEVAPGAKRRQVRRDAPFDRFRDADRARRVVRERPILVVRSDDFGRRLAVPPAPLVRRLDRALVVNQRLWSDRRARPRLLAPAREDVVVVDFGLDLDDELDLFTLPLTLMLTEALVDDVDVVVRTERWATFDRDFDGFVTPVEWPAGNRSFRRLDRDDDLVLVRDELFVDDRLVAVDRDRFLLFEALDRDEDGLVAPWEWPGDLDSFFFRDFNADGAVSLDEFLGLEVDVGVRELGFDTLDFDRDGGVARVEWVGDPVRFARLDRDNDGVVGRWEFGIGWLLGA